MSDYRKEASFLKALIYEHDSELHQRLRAQIAEAEQNDRYLGRAVRLMGLIVLLSCAGIGHLSVLLPEFFDHSRPFLVRLVSALALGSTICLTGLVVYWLWHKAMLRRIYQECRRTIMASLAPQRVLDPAKISLPDTSIAATTMSQIETPLPKKSTG